MSRVRSFAPVSAPDATRLILGSMPGALSLADAQYYAHPQNAFWRIAGALFDFDPALPYAQRCDALRAAGVALWDVLGECVRPGSLDSAIVEASIEANDLAGFLDAHPSIRLICFNGAKAEQSFARHVLPHVSERHRSIPRHRLPSTSPAHAGMRFDAKLACWRAVLLPPAALPNDCAPR